MSFLDILSRQIPSRQSSNLGNFDHRQNPNHDKVSSNTSWEQRNHHLSLNTNQKHINDRNSSNNRQYCYNNHRDGRDERRQGSKHHRRRNKGGKSKNRVQPVISASHVPKSSSSSGINSSSAFRKYHPSESNTVMSAMSPPARGVRPRLDHLQCPVSHKKLMEDITEHSRTTTVTSQSSDDGWSAMVSDHSSSAASSECLMNPRMNKYSMVGPTHNKSYQSRNKARFSSSSSTTNPQKVISSSSHFAKTTSEIVQFQKMVNELETVLRQASSSPEAMWRSRILLNSAQETCQELQSKVPTPTSSSIPNHNNSNKSLSSSSSSPPPQVLLAEQKLHRDWKRVHDHFHTVVYDWQRQQRAELSLFGALKDTSNSPHRTQHGRNNDPLPSQQLHQHQQNDPHTSYPVLYHEEKEDFFDRAMRERQEEIARISKTMNQINDIYADLAGLVDAQQEQIDLLEDVNDDTKAQTKAGLEKIQYKMWAICASTEGTSTFEEHHHQQNYHPMAWYMCAAQETTRGGGARSSYSDKNHIPTDPLDPHASTTSTYDPKLPSSSTNPWKIPPHLESFQQRVQDSAQGAYTVGQALVEELMDQVVDVARQHNLPSPPSIPSWKHAHQQWTNRLSCSTTPVDDDNKSLITTTNISTIMGEELVLDEPNLHSSRKHPQYRSSNDLPPQLQTYTVSNAAAATASEM